MATITTIDAGDNITDSRADINTNFANLNSDKIETSVLDTDTALTANSDAKVATQKAVKAYVDSGGNVNASDTVKGIVEEATAAEVLAGTAVGATGARLYINPSTFPTLTITKNVASGTTTKDLSEATGSQTIAHGLGVAPTYVNLKFALVNSGVSIFAIVDWYTGGVYSSVTWQAVEGGSSATTDVMGVSATNFVIYDVNGNADRYQTGTITVDATNITIAWTKTSTPTGTVNLVWLAQKETITKS